MQILVKGEGLVGGDELPQGIHIYSVLCIIITVYIFQRDNCAVIGAGWCREIDCSSKSDWRLSTCTATSSYQY